MKFFTILSIFYTLNIGLSFKYNYPKLQRNLKLKVIPNDQITSIVDKGLSVIPQETINNAIQYPSLPQIIFQDLFFILNNVLFPIFFIFTIISFFRQPMNMGPMGMSNILNSNSNLNKFDATKQNITMSSWVGSPEVFEEVFEVISYLKNR